MVQEYLRVLILQSDFFICYVIGNIHLMIETVLCVMQSINVHTVATNVSNLQKHHQFVCLSDSLRKQSTIGTQGDIKQQNTIIYNFA